MDAAACHRKKALGHDVQQRRICVPRAVAQQEVQRHGLRELGSAAKALVLAVVQRAEQLRGGAQRVGRHCTGGCERCGGVGIQGAQRRGRGVHRLAPRGPRAGHALQQPREAGNALSIRGREVRPAVERFAVRGEEHRHRPATAPGHRLHGLHVDAVHVRPLLAVHLHVHEQPVHQRRRRGMLERLVCHDMTPVTGGVPDAQQDGTVAASRIGESLLAPRVPVHRIPGMLAQVRGALGLQSVLHAIDTCKSGSARLGLA